METVRGCLLLFAGLGATGCERVFGLDRDHVAPDAFDPCWDSQLQGNEDHDEYPDGCDPCPADVDATVVVNADEDELGDTCDPRPAEAGQSLVTFDGLESSAGWTMTAGTWTFGGGALDQTNPLASGLIERMIDGTQHPGADVLFDGFMGGTAVTPAAGVQFDLGQFNVECSFEPRTQPNEDRFVLKVDNAIVDENVVVGSGALRIQLFQDATATFHCRGSRGATQFREISGTPLAATTSAKLILKARMTVVSFKSVTVFSTQ
jgi:hypothetical protein